MNATATSGGRRSYLITHEEHMKRAAFAVLVWIASYIPIVGLPVLMLGTLWGVFLGTALWILLIGETLAFFLVAVPEVCGLITVNVFQKTTVKDRYANQLVYMTGLWFHYPWEQVKEGLFINLRIVHQPFEEDFPGKDGPRTEHKGDIFYRPVPKWLPRYIAVDDTVINRGLIAITSSILSTLTAGRDAVKARKSIKFFQKKLSGAFRDHDEMLKSASEVVDAELSEEEATHSWLFAIDVLTVKLSDVDYEPDFSITLSKEAQAKRISAYAKQLQEDNPNLSAKDAQNIADIRYGTARKDIFEVEGNAHQALAGLLAGIGRRGNDNQERSGT